MKYFPYIMMFYLSFMLIRFATTSFLNSKHLSKVGIIAEANVMGFIEHIDNEDNATYTPVFAFIDHNDKIIKPKDLTYSSEVNFNVGYTVKVIYDPNNSHNARTMSFRGLYGTTVVLLSWASPLFIIGGGYIFYGINAFIKKHLHKKSVK